MCFIHGLIALEVLISLKFRSMVYKFIYNFALVSIVEAKWHDTQYDI